VSAADAARPSPTIRRQRLGRELRALRESRWLRLEDVAARLGVAPSTLSRIENGKAPIRTSYLTLMMDLYAVDDPDQRRLLTDMAREGQRKGWWTEYADLVPTGTGHIIGLEAAASQIRTYSAQSVPGLLQTEGYAAAVHSATRPGIGAGQVRDLVKITLRRQEILRREGFRLHAVLDESALLRRIGSAAVMADQLGHLAALAASPAVTIEVTRLATAQPVLSPSFALLSFADPADCDLACTISTDGQIMAASRDRHAGAMVRAFTALARSAVPAADLISELAEQARGRGRPG
jgi:transcriptional regulator with XRE-family HTH domain